MPTALVTGASSGLGEHFAYELARERFELILIARREDRLHQVAEKARGIGTPKVVVIKADLSRRDSAQAVYDQVMADGHQVEWLINNAGFGTRGAFAGSDLARRCEEIDLNVTALVSLTRLFLPSMVEANRGTIINVASTAAFQPVPYMSTYAATKAFVLSFTESLHAELKGTGVHVMASCPGPTYTEFQRVAGTKKVRLPNFAYMDAQTVVKQALASARARRPLCINGTINWMMVESLRMAPRALVARIAEIMFRPPSN